jgi:hypothetical protein
VLLGWTVTRSYRLLRTLHIASLIYAIVIELVPWVPCPLTVAEAWLEARSGIERAHRPFLVRVLDAVVYPDLPDWLVVGCAVLVCVAILSVYLRRPDGGRPMVTETTSENSSSTISLKASSKSLPNFLPNPARIMPNYPDQYLFKRLKTFKPISSDTFSRPPHSTTLPLLRRNGINRLGVHEDFFSAHLLPKILRELLHRFRLAACNAL